MVRSIFTAYRLYVCTLIGLVTVVLPLRASAPHVYVVLWFDTEDYILPASDDAAKRIAEILTRQGIRATFKVVGEKARTLEARGRKDVIEALKKHEIGYHSNYHSFQPSPAMYLADLGWDEGVAEFDRRERPGYNDVTRIFGMPPSCYGQPGSSWAPQSYGAMKQWKMQVYLDAGRHVNLDDRPCYYCGILNLYKLEFLMRADLNKPGDLPATEQKFIQACEKLKAEGGGVVSVMYHPCEFVHKEFWDGVNFRNGANPPREKWKLPRIKTVEDSESAYRVFDEFVRFMKRFAEVRFITASEATELYRDNFRGRRFSTVEIEAIARAVTENVSIYQTRGGALSAAEIFALLNAYVAEKLARTNVTAIALPAVDVGPSEMEVDQKTNQPDFAGRLTTDRSQFQRTVADVDNFIRKRERIPSVVWLGSTSVPPEVYLLALAHVAQDLLAKTPISDSIDLKPARIAAAKYVSDDVPVLWRWVIFPRGFRAPRMMQLAKQQAWTLKPAILQNEIK
jgi:hypothetical protein